MWVLLASFIDLSEREVVSYFRSSRSDSVISFTTPLLLNCWLSWSRARFTRARFSCTLFVSSAEPLGVIWVLFISSFRSSGRRSDPVVDLEESLIDVHHSLYLHLLTLLPSHVILSPGSERIHRSRHLPALPIRWPVVGSLRSSLKRRRTRIALCDKQNKHPLELTEHFFMRIFTFVACLPDEEKANTNDSIKIVEHAEWRKQWRARVVFSSEKIPLRVPDNLCVFVDLLESFAATKSFSKLTGEHIDTGHTWTWQWADWVRGYSQIACDQQGAHV